MKHRNVEHPDPDFPGGFTTRDEANALVARVLRDGPLDRLFAGHPSAPLTDPGLSRITDDEVTAVLLHACEELAELLRFKEQFPADYVQWIKNYNLRHCRGWRR